MVDFTTGNPALDAFYATRRADTQQNLADAQAGQAEQQIAAKNAVDEGLRQWFLRSRQPAAQPAAPAAVQPASPESGTGASPSASGTIAPQTPATLQTPSGSRQPPSFAPSGGLSTIGVGAPPSDIMASVAQTPGTGGALAGMAQAAYQRRYQLVNGMFDALNKGNVAQAKVLSQMSGLQLPEQAWQDGRTLRTLGLFSHFGPLYKDDPERYGAFLSDAMRGADANGGIPDFEGALQRNPPRSKGAANVAGFTETMGRAPSDYEAAGMFGAHTIAPLYGQPVPVAGPDGKTTYAIPNRRTGTLTPTGSAAAPRPAAPLYGTTTVQGANGPEVATVDRRTGKVVATGQAAPPRATPMTQADRDFSAATHSVDNDPTFIGKTEAERGAEIQRRYDALRAGRERNHTSAGGAAPTGNGATVTTPRADAGPAQAPAGQKHAGTAQDPYQPADKAAYDALPAGAVYAIRDAQGNPHLFRKGG